MIPTAAAAARSPWYFANERLCEGLEPNCCIYVRIYIYGRAVKMAEIFRDTIIIIITITANGRGIFLLFYFSPARSPLSPANLSRASWCSHTRSRFETNSSLKNDTFFYSRFSYVYIRSRLLSMTMI